ncbi:MAG TPA: hypothetical protein VMD53_07225 [Rhizomicrobium sp.]|nr:hypothetical protein [Rhizomicrobium sp.]
MPQRFGFTKTLGNSRISHGIVPPNYILDLTIAQLNRTQKPADQSIPWAASAI